MNPHSSNGGAVENMKEGQRQDQQSAVWKTASSYSFEAPQVRLGLGSILFCSEPAVTVVARAALPCRDRNEEETPSYLTLGFRLNKGQSVLGPLVCRHGRIYI